MRIWIDIANAPHVTFFRPVVARLRDLGEEVILTGHDRGQTLALARATWPDIEVVGAGYRNGMLGKSLAVLGRSLGLQRAVRHRQLDVAVGHNSYPQIVAARMLGIPSLTIMDYEHQPANHLAFRLASRVLVPRVIPPETLHRFGVGGIRLVRYNGLKEEIALATYHPDPEFRRRRGIDETKPLVTLRPPAHGALYHRHRNDLFDAAVRTLAATDATVVLTPRTRTQADEFEQVEGLRVLRDVVPGPDLLFQSDLFVGAGGTMTREAAVLGTPTVSIFTGRPAAVDSWLEQAGRLRIARDTAGLRQLVRRRSTPHDWVPDPAIVETFTATLLRAAADALQER